MKVDSDIVPVSLSFLPSASANWWMNIEEGTIHRSELAAQNTMRIHYRRPDGDYGNYQSANSADYWGLDTGQGAADPTPWEQPLKPAGTDRFGVYFDVPLADRAFLLAYALHRGDEKDPGTNQFVRFSDSGYEVWQVSGADASRPHILDTPDSRPAGYPDSLADAQSRDTRIAWSGNGLVLSVETVPGRLYSPRNSVNLSEWLPSADPFEGDGETHTFTLDDPPTGWYRFNIE